LSCAAAVQRRRKTMRPSKAACSPRRLVARRIQPSGATIGPHRMHALGGPVVPQAALEAETRTKQNTLFAVFFLRLHSAAGLLQRLKASPSLLFYYSWPALLPRSALPSSSIAACWRNPPGSPSHDPRHSSCTSTSSFRFRSRRSVCAVRQGQPWQPRPNSCLLQPPVT
jgi:hypothetical protein